ncbi:MAG: NAD(P)H-dependent oxidoreductase [Rhizobiales bacterium]|nr:NAD(P)H-dependent oxidoreductase [Hyphomicrobiales bacterium]
MNTLIVHAHPEPKSFNGAKKDLAVEAFAAAGHERLKPGVLARSGVQRNV